MAPKLLGISCSIYMELKLQLLYITLLLVDSQHLFKLWQ